MERGLMSCAPGGLGVLLTVLLLSACGATPYQPEGYRGGYSETQIDAGVFEVWFRGNAHTSMERARDFALLRSAMVTLRDGCRYFVILGDDGVLSQSTLATPSYHPAIPDQTRTRSKPRALIRIRTLSEEPGAGIDALSAYAVIAAIREKYGLD